MDPIQIIVTALATGAAAGLKPTAEQAVKDAYARVKTFLKSRYAAVDLEALEKKPESENKQASLAEDLADAGASEDLELMEQAKDLVEAVEKHAPASAAAIGVDLQQVKAEFLRVQKVTATGTGVKVTQGEFSGGIDLGEVTVGQGSDSGHP